MVKRIFVNYFIYILISVLSVNSVWGQQSNKPQLTPAVVPTVKQVPGAYGSNTKVNYVRTWQSNAPITDPNALITADFKDVLQTTQYVDGLGRPLQTVSRRSTPDYKDQVSPVLYDEFGRESYQYLPYASAGIDGSFKMDPFNEQKLFMQGLFNEEQVYYNANEYETSPLNRVVKTMAPGNNWGGSGRGVSLNYLINSTNDSVRIWSIDNNRLTYNKTTKDANVNIPYSPATPGSPIYNTGELYKNVTKDESGNAVVEYKDKKGLLVLKKVQIGGIDADYSGYNGFLCTYYIYDGFNRLRFVISPKGVSRLMANSWQFTNDIINELCFRYEYDAGGHMIAKKVPGADWVYMVYDVRDRLVFTQDGNMRKNNQWHTVLYDVLNRTVMTGITVLNTDDHASLTYNVIKKTSGIVYPPGVPIELSLPQAGQAVPINGIFQATYNIALVEGFGSGSDFTADIITGTIGGSTESTIDGMQVNLNPIPSDGVFVALTKTYFDSYSNWTNKTYTDKYNSRLDAGANRNPIIPPSVNNKQTVGLVTGSATRVILDPQNLSTGNWLTSINFFDDRNRIIQTYNETLKGTDTTTNLYDFSGKILSSYLVHNNTAITPGGIHVQTNIEYDHVGRLKEVWKILNDDITKKALITRNEYNELGQLISKELGHKKDDNGNYTALQYDALETLKYSYNIRGWLTGINKDYVDINNPSGVTDSWFGMELNYDKGFQVPQYNGNIAGTKWRSKGDGERRAFGYTYDQASRILGADFSQVIGSNYNEHPTIQFDMEMGNTLKGLPAYDENGNIGAMKHKGLKLGNSQVIDELVYDYHNGGNKLKSVKDWAADASGAVGGNWGLGDFTDKNSGDDYGYDVNGNMMVDLNKKMNGTPGIDQASGAITYNHLNLPYKILVDGGNKGTITYIYDAAGQKLSKVVEDKSVAGKIVTTTTSYIGGLVYESKTTNPADPVNDYIDKLQFINHEEGRLRYIQPTDSVAARFEYDYFVKDHLGNVRVVLTEEKVSHDYMATMEKGAGNEVRNVENQLFSNLDASEFPTASVPGSGYPPGSSATDPNEYVAKVNGSTNKKGPAIVLKVMAGDSVDFRVRYFYQDKSNPGGTVNVVSDILSSLAGGIVNAAGEVKGTLSELSDPGGLLGGALNSFRNDKNPENSGKPKAYLNWILVDEQFNYVSTQSGALPVNQQDQVLTLCNDMAITKNGYLYIYVSNETEFWDVYFDDLKIKHSSGALLEETHYYPFGLTMAGISSKAIGKPENLKKYNGIELNSSLDLNVYDAFYRNLDPQVGRFWQVDPAAEGFQDCSPYESMGNNPVNNIDPLGDFSSRFGAWLNRLFHGGGEIKKNEYGEWFVEKTRTEAMADGNTAIVSYKYYGKGRNQYTAAGENIRDEQERQADIDHMVKLGVYQRVNTQQEANEGNLKAFAGVLMPNIIKALSPAAKALPNSGPIMKSLGAASKAEMLAKKLKLNINSETTRQVLNSLEETVESFITKYRKASIKAELPGEFLPQTVEEALRSGNTTVRKLLIDNRFVK